MDPSPELRSRSVGLGVIVSYKVVKAAVELCFGAILLGMVAAGLSGKLASAALEFRHHMAEPWSIRLAEVLIRTTTVRTLRVVGLAALFDGLSSLVEGWALHRQLWWGGWLVICTTSAAIPLELIAIVHHPSVTRIALLIINAMIVIYLVHRHVTGRGVKMRP